MTKRLSKSGNTETPVLFQVVFRIPFLQYPDDDESNEPMTDHIYARINTFSSNFTPKRRVVDGGFNISLGDMASGGRPSPLFLRGVYIILLVRFPYHSIYNLYS